MSMKVPPLDLKRQHKALQEEVFSAIQKVIESGQFILGPDVQAFETAMAKKLAVHSAIGVSSGTDALILALRALEIGPGDKVLTSPFTFFATCSAILNVGATPVFADIDPETFTIAPAAVETALANDPSITAVIPVHLYGQTAEMGPILKIAKKHGVKVIEDACQAIGAHYQGIAAGSLGDLGCFSFFPTKNLGCYGDAGMVTTQSAELAERVKALRAHGSPKKYHHERIGGNHRMDTFHAATLRVLLKDLDLWITQRQALAATYDSELAGMAPKIVVPKRLADANHTFHQYTLRVQDRDGLQKHLSDKGISSTVYYPIPCHLQQALKASGHEAGDFPVSEKAALEVLSIPIFPGMTAEEQAHVISSIKEWAKKSSGTARRSSKEAETSL